MENLANWLFQNFGRISENGNSIIHGNFKLDKIIFHPDEPKIISILGNFSKNVNLLDWEYSGIGDPLIDLANFCLTYNTTPEIPSL